MLPTVTLPTKHFEPVLLCLSHLRWHFVHQRPQHLMRRAAAGQTVLFFEEPVLCDTGVLPRLELTRQPGGVIFALPVLRPGMSRAEENAAQWLEPVDEYLRDMSWDDTWARMWALMQETRHSLSSPQVPEPAVHAKSHEGAVHV